MVKDVFLIDACVWVFSTLLRLVRRLAMAVTATRCGGVRHERVGSGRIVTTSVRSVTMGSLMGCIATVFLYLLTMLLGVDVLHKRFEVVKLLLTERTVMADVSTDNKRKKRNEWGTHTHTHHSCLHH